MIEQQTQRTNSSPAPQVSTRSGVSAALRSLTFRVLWLSEAISLVGDRILMVALINLVYERSGSAAAVGLLSMIKALPALLFGTLAGVFVDRWSRKWTMVFSNLALFGLVLAIPLADRLGAAALPVIFAVYFGMAVISQFFIPARSATIPNLVPADALTAANALFASAFVGAMVVGPALGGWISDALGLRAAFLIDALTFLVPAAAVSLLVIPAGPRRMDSGTGASGDAGASRDAGASGDAGAHSLVADWREGFAVMKREPKYSAALLLLAVAGLLIAALSSLGVMVVREKFSGSAADFGWMMSAVGGGMLCGVIASMQAGKRIARQALATGGVLLAAAAIIGIALAPLLPLVMGCGFLLGIGMITVQVQMQTTLQSAPDEVRGRLMGAAQSVMGSMTFLIAGLAGLLAARFGATLVLLGAGLIAAAAAAAVLLFSPSFNRS